MTPNRTSDSFMKIRILKKQLKRRGLTINSLVHFWDEAQTELSNKRALHHEAPSAPSTHAYIYRSELDYISRCILDYKNIETGGQLFGYWTSEGSPVVVYAIGPGRNANHQVAFFNQDMDYLVTIGTILVRHYGLHHIGEWHSHHQLGLAHPSGHDASTMADTIRNKNLGRFLLCIGNCTEKESALNPFNFVQEYGYNYVKAQWRVYDIESPYRNLVDLELHDLLEHPKTPHARYNMTATPQTSGQAFTQDSHYWISKKENRLVLKNILDFLSSSPVNGICKVQMDENHHVHIFIKHDKAQEHIYFPKEFPLMAPISARDGNEISDYTWDFNGDILKAFINYYKSFNHYDGR